MASSNCTWQENTDLLVTCESITMPGYNTRYTQRITECINREYLTQNASALRYTPYDGYDYKAAAVCSFQ
ncbi:hypothetical protein IJM86_07360 [bacterium]|nr:hypothetical protein [bacterium]